MFSLNENSNVIIYGAATSGEIIYNILKKNRIDILAFIDKRADELNELHGKRVVQSIEDINDIYEWNCIVIVAVKNVFEHSKIASKLVDNGIKNIIYKPYTILTGSGSDDERRISECYDYLLNNELAKLSNIPETNNIINYKCSDLAFISRQDNWIWARVPVCLIYADKVKTKKSIWADIPVLAMFPHIELFQAFLCNNVENGIENYIEFCCEAAENTGEIKTTERWKQNVLANRLDVFQNMNMAYELDKDFFIRNAPRAEWNEEGYFNLLGGKHRAAFLAAKGDRYIVLQISKADYQKWINHVMVPDLERRLNCDFQGEIQKGIIEHPYFYRYPFAGEVFIYNMWMQICSFLAHYIFSTSHNFVFRNMTTLVSIEDMGYIARNLSRIGTKVYRQTENRQLEKMINELMSVKIEDYLEKDIRPEVDLAVVENTVYEKAQFCFLVSDLEPGKIEKMYNGRMLFQGVLLLGKRYTYLIENKCKGH